MNKKELKELRDYLKAEKDKENKEFSKSFWSYLNKINMFLGLLLFIIGMFFVFDFVIAGFGALIYNLSIHKEKLDKLEELVVNGSKDKGKN